MQRRNFLVGIGSASVGGSALLGSGAFSRVESHRNITVEVAEDPSAYLGLDKCDTPNGSYVNIDDMGHLEILMNPDNPTIGESPLGSGVNSNSISSFDNVFQICNQGKEQACVWIEDDAAWPTVPEEETMGGERRVEFYLNGFRDQSVIGEGNGISLEVGECVCIGIETRTFGLSEGDELLSELENQVQIVADVDSECGAEQPCPDLTANYQCTTYDAEGGGYSATGTRFEVQNVGSSTVFDLAVANDPGSWREDVSIGANTTTTVVADASFPKKALIAWNVPDDCSPRPDAQTWDEYKTEQGIEDLEEWYETFGSEGSTLAPGAPVNLPDDVVVEVRDIPEEGLDPAVGPDDTISDEDFPEMSQDAADLGWIACEAFDAQDST